MNTTKTIKRCPSWSKVSGMMGEWSRFERHGSNLSPDRANEIAANLYAVNIAKRTGKRMPKDWSSVTPSMPYQLSTWADRISESELVSGANRLTWFDIDLS